MDWKKFYAAATDWVINYGPRILVGVVVYLIGLRIIRTVKNRVRGKMTQKQIHSSLQPFLLSLSISALHILLALLVMNIVGIGVTIFATLAGAITVTIGLALSGTLQNFAGGVFILILKPFTIDDNIIAQGVDGVVTSIQVFYTEVLTGDNKTVIIPNGKLFNEIITNVTREGHRRIDFEIKLGYIVDIEQVKSLIIQAIQKTENISPSPEPVVGVSAMELDGVRIITKVWVKTDQFGATSLDLHENVLTTLKGAGVKLPGL
ncbi:Ion channel protein [Mucilaginibacter sp. PPCGB 2223]|uniref:mechanosensitive ion channel family protein n=1 Tax=Mucilaginibacter sp. PPCGB 2223 TaxID=1886027 RepID=UPI0008256ED5|nr:mechanosensitive ion channel family protein [Mucilaginibacter sp. PPCGB 2223]OCX50768.1 Ion channel protein [Mucilaginibacter sp. PPCGB 2223]